MSRRTSHSPNVNTTLRANLSSFSLSANKHQIIMLIAVEREQSETSTCGFGSSFCSISTMSGERTSNRYNYRGRLSNHHDES